MGFTHIATVGNYAAGPGTTVDASATLNIAANDVLVTVCFQGAYSGDTTFAVADTSGNNTHTMATKYLSGGAKVNIGYRLVGEADATATIRLTYGEERTELAFTTYQFRPDGGDTIAFDVEAGVGGGYDNAPDSGNVTTTGTDEIVVGGMSTIHDRTVSTPLIGGSAPDGNTVQSSGLDFAMYTLYTETKTDIAASGTYSGDATWACAILSIKATAAGGSIAILTRYRMAQ